MLITPSKAWFNPYNIFTQTPGCVLYFDARDPLNNNASSRPTPGSQLPIFYDKSGYKDNFSQGTTSQEPNFVPGLFGQQPGISFNSANNMGLYTTTGPILSSPVGSWTIFYVINISSTTEYFITDSQGKTYRFIVYSMNNTLNVQVTSSITATFTGLTVGSPIVLSVVLDATGNTSNVYQNSIALSGQNVYTASAPLTKLTLGIDYGNSFAPFNGGIGAYIWYNRALSAATRLSIERALGNGFGIATG